ncbi:PREDICTED: bifunctional lysine-specific demethylase and histidyl-hydroxylase NO66 [Cyphomyrmex costatus]|nr:PREDICTED: bifunctional lysine-specific demethylase and histidyl-hydroxylase NO66 [Cyphomyrmex costatus]
MSDIENDHDPVKDCHQLLKWMIYPMDVDNFFKQNWEKNPLYVNRESHNFYKKLLTLHVLDDTLKNNNVLFTKHIDITSYSNGVRETHNPPGRAYSSVVWDYYRNKCSVRMLNPQIFMGKIHALNATLQEFFGCFVGANIYLTPPNSQGFAPHYDDVEAFILQVEGEKRWKLYKPLKQNQYLPRYSSKNFDQSEIGEPIMDTIVKAGDLLYLPRGTIHQAMTRNSHSLHITVSVYQRNSWCNLLEKVLPQALKQATKNNVCFREGLPLNYLKYVGEAYDSSCHKDAFKNNVKTLITLLLDYIDIDNAADLMAKGHIHDFLPPYVFKKERRNTILEDGEFLNINGYKCYKEIKLSTRIRLLRLHCIRLIKEDVYKIYYSTDNSKEYHEYEPHFLEIDKELVPAIKQIITCYPDFISVRELRIKDDDIKIQVAKDLWEKNLIITKVPL